MGGERRKITEGDAHGLHNSIKIYFSKLRKLKTTNTHITTTTRRFLSVCKHPRTPSFAVDDACRPEEGGKYAGGHAATLSDVERFLFENFNSLYIHDTKDVDVDNNHFDSKCSSDRKKCDVDPPSPVSLSSKLSATSTSSSSASSTGTPLKADPDKTVAVMTFSKDPYDDFRRSMQEMVETRQASCKPGGNKHLDWDFMVELLFCYLELNDRSVHKYVLEAFTDLTAGLRRRSTAGRCRVPDKSGGGGRRRKVRLAENEV